MNRKCYNSGKIGGLSYLTAYNKFELYDARIKALGYTPINPMKDGLKPSYPYWMHLLYDIWLLLGCDTIYLQEDWKSSRGARIEYRISKLLKKEIIYNITI